jgi:hypothetical protein
MFTYKNTCIRRPMKHLGTKNGLTNLYTTKTKMYIIHHSGCLYRTTTCSSLRRRWWPTTTCPRRWWRTTHRTLLPRAAGIHSSSQQALLLAALWPAMVAAPPHTAPGSSHPGYASTCPQAHPATPSPDDSVCHQNPLRLPPEERVMAPHLGHRTDASSLPSQAQLVAPRHPPTDASLLW